jgi:hypothetical protein
MNSPRNPVIKRWVLGNEATRILIRLEGKERKIDILKKFKKKIQFVCSFNVAMSVASLT